MVTTQTCATGVPVIEKLVEAWVVFVVVEKKLVMLPSGAELTAIVTPLAGMAEVIFTFREKVGPGAGAWVVPVPGVVTTVSVASGVLLLPHPPDTRPTKAIVIIAEKNRFIEKCIICNKDNVKIVIIVAHLFLKDLHIPAETFVQGDKGLGTFDALYLL
jgi:hypothetical protein